MRSSGMFAGTFFVKRLTMTPRRDFRKTNDTKIVPVNSSEGEGSTEVQSQGAGEERQPIGKRGNIRG
jgi:hypothetical protein